MPVPALFGRSVAGLRRALAPLDSWRVERRLEQLPLEEMFARSVVSEGDLTRLAAAFARARCGATLRLGTIGGSISAGAGATSVARRWPEALTRYLAAVAPDVALINAALGATGSEMGAHRISEHLMAHGPHVVVVEFAVNDIGCPLAGETLEGLVRQALRAPGEPAVVLLLLMTAAGEGAHAVHEMVGRHYALPIVSLREAVAPVVAAGRLAQDELFADEVHPSDLGHLLVARLLAALFERGLSARVRRASKLPPPRFTRTFERARFFDARVLHPVSAEGFAPFDGPRFGLGWRAERAGSRVAFDVEGSAISVVHTRRAHPSMGRAEARVGVGAPVVLDGFQDPDWGGRASWTLVGNELARGTHRLEITLLDDGDRNRFDLEAVLAAGP